jgi:hypothetical protein
LVQSPLHQRRRASVRARACRAAAAAGLLGALLIVPSNASAGQSRTDDAAPATLERWIALDLGTAAVRHHLVRDAHATLLNQVQTQEQVRGRVKLDGAGRYGIGFGIQTGAGFPGSWNATGIGTGDGTGHIFLKHLFLDAAPARGIELQYGSLRVDSGQVSEITAYDNDGYFEGGRAIVRRPGALFFDEITVTVAYLGDLGTSNVFSRLKRLDRENSRQLMVARRIGARVIASADLTGDAIEHRLLRMGARARIGQPWLDALRIEECVRLDGAGHHTGFGLTAEKAIGGAALFGGYSRVQPLAAPLNGDRYGIGERLFAGGSYPLPRDLSIGWFVGRQLDAPATALSKTRVDLVLTWNVLHALRRDRNSGVRNEGGNADGRRRD